MIMRTPPDQNDRYSTETPRNTTLNSILPAERLISGWILAALLVMTVIYLIRPLYDPDFYWHLKTGEWIWQNKALPGFDPFGIQPATAPPPRTEFILSSYWLAQIAMYACYSLFGMSGIIMFRLAIIGLWIFMWSRWTSVRNFPVATVIATGTILLLELYFIERPQFISFLCFGLLLVLLFRFLEHPVTRTLRSTLVPLSLVMVVWANMHGGYIIGQAILVYFIVAEGVKFCKSSLSPLPARDYATFCIVSLAALFASFLNPNAINAFRYLPEIFDSSSYVNRDVLEEMSLYKYFRVTRQGTAVVYAAAIAVTMCAFVSSVRRRDITWIGVLAGTAYMGYTHMRLMPFFLTAAILFLVRYIDTEGMNWKMRIITYSMLAATILVCFSDELPNRLREPVTGWVPTRYFPVAAADFVIAEEIEGNIYSPLRWGGYLVWRVGPDRKVFIDGRFTSIQRIWEYNNSLVVAMNRQPYWKGLFDTYDIGVAVMPVYGMDGSPNPLTQSIAADPEWSTLFANRDHVVLVRNLRLEEGT